MSKISGLYIAFGANLSNPEKTFRKAVAALHNRGIMVQANSSLWQSPAWPPGSDQPDYINAVMSAEFSGSAREALSILHDVEAEFGRVRSVKNAPRTLDLDLIDFNGVVIDAFDITLPHPRMMDRGFVLLPLAEIAPNWCHAVSGVPIMEALARLPASEILPMQWRGHFARGKTA